MRIRGSDGHSVSGKGNPEVARGRFEAGSSRAFTAALIPALMPTPPPPDAPGPDDPQDADDREPTPLETEIGALEAMLPPTTPPDSAEADPEDAPDEDAPDEDD